MLNTGGSRYLTLRLRCRPRRCSGLDLIRVGWGSAVAGGLGGWVKRRLALMGGLAHPH
jgi:hypothetical protein